MCLHQNGINGLQTRLTKIHIRHKCMFSLSWSEIQCCFHSQQGCIFLCNNILIIGIDY